MGHAVALIAILSLGVVVAAIGVQLRAGVQLRRAQRAMRAQSEARWEQAMHASQCHPPASEPDTAWPAPMLYPADDASAAAVAFGHGAVQPRHAEGQLGPATARAHRPRAARRLRCWWRLGAAYKYGLVFALGVVFAAMILEARIWRHWEEYARTEIQASETMFRTVAVQGVRAAHASSKARYQSGQADKQPPTSAGGTSASEAPSHATNDARPHAVVSDSGLDPTSVSMASEAGSPPPAADAADTADAG